MVGYMVSLIRCPNVSQFMSPVQSPGFTPTHALLDLLLELLSISWSCMPNYELAHIASIAVTTISLFRFRFLRLQLPHTGTENRHSINLMPLYLPLLLQSISEQILGELEMQWRIFVVCMVTSYLAKLETGRNIAQTECHGQHSIDCMEVVFTAWVTQWLL